MIMALAAAHDGERDKPMISRLARKLEQGQIKSGVNSGIWTYNVARSLQVFSGDRSNGQFAILGLRDAARSGVSIDREVWRRARAHWERSQNPDGGWGYSASTSSKSTGSMTVAGIATMTISRTMLRDGDDLNPDGTPLCCEEVEPNDAMQRALRWMESHFTVRTNPGNGSWLLYYLYGLERAGRLSGTRFFGRHDWYRTGAEWLVKTQLRGTGNWRGEGTMERDPVIATSFALLFLSKGLAPVLVNKLKYGPPDPAHPRNVLGQNWTRHPDDIRNLTELISGLPKWPHLVTWQTLDMNLVEQYGGVDDMLQAPVLYISGKDAPELNEPQVELLKEFVNRGGFVFAVANCGSGEFDAGFRDLVQRMFPENETQMSRLTSTHPVFRSEHLLDADSVELWGVDFGCRTAIIYSPEDLSCLWEKWKMGGVRDRTLQAKTMITRATRIGVNVIAYATGREPPKKLDRHPGMETEGFQDQIERSLLQIAKLRHSGQWNAAPNALRNLLSALNRTVGMSASTTQRDLLASDPNLFRYPILYMHGRNFFQLSEPEQQQLQTYLERGGLLFADSCCGSRQFDRGFRKLVAQLFPGKNLRRLPVDHSIFTESIGHDVRTIRRRVPESDNPNAALISRVESGEPFLEGIEIEGRLAIIYSKYDISCAIERQASTACSGYIFEDATKLAVNIVLYALLQDARPDEPSLNSPPDPSTAP